MNDDEQTGVSLDSLLQVQVDGATTFYIHVVDWRGNARPDMLYDPSISRRELMTCTLAAAPRRTRSSSTAAAAEPAADRHVILLTLDGVRVQDLFAGMDPVIANAPEVRVRHLRHGRDPQRYWRDTPQQRREALMPFFWKTLVPAGMMLGNQAIGSKVTVRNNQWFSYPGYSEILTGRAAAGDPEQRLRPLPARTVLDYAQRNARPEFTEVAQIGSWDGFKYAASRRTALSS